MAAETGRGRVEVAYALPDRQRIVTLELREGMTAQQAVEVSGLLAEFPELLAHGPLHIGIYGRMVDGTQALRDGDRVEIYRPLKADPRDQRRRLAAGAARGTRLGRRGR